MAKVPSYVTHELARRINAGGMSKLRLIGLFGRAGIEINAKPKPEPDFEELIRMLGPQPDGVGIQTGAIEVEGHLTLLGLTQPLRLRLSYAIAGDDAISDWHVLVWEREEPAPAWMRVPVYLFDPEILEASEDLIIANAYPEISDS